MEGRGLAGRGKRELGTRPGGREEQCLTLVSPKIPDVVGPFPLSYKKQQRRS